MSTWRDKLHYFNSGMGAVLAILLAMAGSATCFLFAFVAFMCWTVGDANLAVKEKRGDEDGKL